MGVMKKSWEAAEQCLALEMMRTGHDGPSTFPSRPASQTWSGTSFLEAQISSDTINEQRDQRAAAYFQQRRLATGRRKHARNVLQEATETRRRRSKDDSQTVKARVANLKRAAGKAKQLQAHAEKTLRDVWIHDDVLEADYDYDLFYVSEDLLGVAGACSCCEGSCLLLLPCFEHEYRYDRYGYSSDWDHGYDSDGYSSGSDDWYDPFLHCSGWDEMDEDINALNALLRSCSSSERGDDD